MTDETGTRPIAAHGLRLRVTKQEHEQLRQEAETQGTDVSTLLRMRIFGKLKGMRIVRRPTADMMVLGDIIGRLSKIASELNKLGSNLNQIAKRLNQGSRDLFGLDGAIRTFERIGQDLTKALGLIESAIMGRKKINHEPEE